jgi:hypothetical protein
MKIKLTRYSKVGNTRREGDKTAEVEWSFTVSKSGYISVEIETGHVYTAKLELVDRSAVASAYVKNYGETEGAMAGQGGK